MENMKLHASFSSCEYRAKAVSVGISSVDALKWSTWFYAKGHFSFVKYVIYNQNLCALSPRIQMIWWVKFALKKKKITVNSTYTLRISTILHWITKVQAGCRLSSTSSVVFPFSFWADEYWRGFLLLPYCLLLEMDAAQWAAEESKVKGFSKFPSDCQTYC